MVCIRCWRSDSPRVPRRQYWRWPLGQFDYFGACHHRHGGVNLGLGVDVGKRVSPLMVLVTLFTFLAFLVHKLTVFPRWVAGSRRIPSRTVAGTIGFVFIGLRTSGDARQALGAVSPGPVSYRPINTLSRKLRIDGAGGGGLEFECFSARPLMRSSLSDVETFGFQSFHSIRIGVILCGNSKSPS